MKRHSRPRPDTNIVSLLASCGGLRNFVIPAAPFKVHVPEFWDWHRALPILAVVVAAGMPHVFASEDPDVDMFATYPPKTEMQTRGLACLAPTTDVVLTA
jgi:hypothetical protein